MSSVLCQIRGCAGKPGRSWKAWANLLALVGQSKQSAGLALELGCSWVVAEAAGGTERRAETSGPQLGRSGQRRPNRRGLPFPAWERPPQTPPRPPPLQARSGPIEAPGAEAPPNPGAGPRLSTLRDF